MHSIIHARIPKSIISFVQEIGRCERILYMISSINNSYADSCSILFNIRDYIYCYESYLKLEESIEESNSISNTINNNNIEYIEMKILPLNKILSLCFLVTDVSISILKENHASELTFTTKVITYV